MLPAPSDGNLAFLRVVLSIQEMTRTPLSIPARALQSEELLTIVLTEQGLRTGSVTRPVSNAHAHVDRAGVEAILREPGGSGKYTVVLAEKAPVFVLGKEIPVGPREYVVSGIDVSDEERARLKTELEAIPEEPDLLVNFAPSGEQMLAEIRYLNWPLPQVSDGV
jgi:hypothetical protein